MKKKKTKKAKLVPAKPQAYFPERLPFGRMIPMLTVGCYMATKFHSS
jgi:hypothetical protein